MEHWKDIVGYEGLYQVSDLGRVRSLPHSTTTPRGIVQHRPGKIIKPQARRHGYLSVCLYGRGGNARNFKQLSVHRLVADAFIDNPNGYEEVNHLNEIKTDNQVNNLEWCSHKQNSIHGTRPQKIAKASYNHGRPIVQMDLEGNVIAEFANARRAEEATGISHKRISYVCHRPQTRTKYDTCLWAFRN